MRKRIGVAAVAATFVCSAGAARAQMSQPEPRRAFVSVNGSGQLQERSFSSSSTFSTFSETGGLASIQTIGRGGVVDVTGGYRFGSHLGIAVSVWGASTKSAAATSATVADPLFFGRFKTISMTSDDAGQTLKQTDLGASLLLTWTTALTDKLDASVFLGPGFVRVKQDVASAAVTPGSQTVTMGIDSQSASTAKAGTVGLGITQRVSDRFGVGVFVRYTGGEVNLPAVSKLKIGGLQVGGGVRALF